MDLNKSVNVLDKNVDEIVGIQGQVVGAIGDIIAYLDTAEKRFAHLEGHIGQLSKRPAVIVKPNSKLFLLTAVVASGYLGYKLADRRFREKVQEMVKQGVQEAQEKFEQAKQSAQEQMKPSSGPYDAYPTNRSVDSTDNDI